MESNYIKRIPVLPALLGISLILIAIHRALPVVPSVGYFIILGLITIFLTEHAVAWKEIEPGEKGIYIPLLVIFLITVVQVYLGTTTIPAMLFMLMMVLIYFMSREYNASIFTIFIPALIAVSLSCIIMNGIINPGFRGASLLHPWSYNIAVGFMALGVVLARGKWQWILIALVLPGLFLTGSDQAIIFIVGFIALALIRKDFSRKFIPTALILTTAVVIFVSIGTTQVQYLPAMERIQVIMKLTNPEESIVETNPEELTIDEELQDATGFRWIAYKEALTSITILGHGFNPTDASAKSIHNVPLKVMNEMGPVAMLAWLWLVGYGIFKLRRVYIFTTILILSTFDNMVWTQLTPYMFIALGMKLPTSDYIFRCRNE